VPVDDVAGDLASRRGVTALEDLRVRPARNVDRSGLQLEVVDLVEIAQMRERALLGRLEQATENADEFLGVAVALLVLEPAHAEGDSLTLEPARHHVDR